MAFFRLKEGRTISREALDQTLHAVYAIALWAIAYYPIPGWLACLISMAFGVLRELEQHEWDFRSMGRQDLFFWFCASILTTILYYSAPTIT